MFHVQASHFFQCLTDDLIIPCTSKSFLPKPHKGLKCSMYEQVISSMVLQSPESSGVMSPCGEGYSRIKLSDRLYQLDMALYNKNKYIRLLSADYLCFKQLQSSMHCSKTPLVEQIYFTHGNNPNILQVETFKSCFVVDYAFNCKLCIQL